MSYTGDDLTERDIHRCLCVMDEVGLTLGEKRVMHVLLSCPGPIRPRDIAVEIYDDFGPTGDSFRSTIRKIRRKLAGTDFCITTRYGYGYQVEVVDAVPAAVG